MPALYTKDEHLFIFTDRIFHYTQTCLERSMPRESHERPDIHFNIVEPVTKNMVWEMAFLWPMEQSFKTSSTVHVFEVLKSGLNRII